MRLSSLPYFLRIYSGLLTVAFVLTVSLGLARGDFALNRVSASEQQNSQHPFFDQITVHRINVVEPDGTPRLIISNKAEFAGEFYRGKEISRPDRQDSAGMLFLNDEGTENGGMLFGGYKSKEGAVHSFGHLSFDEYEQDQTLSLDTDQDGQERSSSYQINDNNVTLMTPEVFSAYKKVHAMPVARQNSDLLSDQVDGLCTCFGMHPCKTGSYAAPSEASVDRVYPLLSFSMRPAPRKPCSSATAWRFQTEASAASICCY